PTEPALEERRPEDGFLTSDCMPMERFGCQSIHLVLAVAASLGGRPKRSPRPGGLSSRSASGDQTCALLPAPRRPYPGDPYLMASGPLAAGSGLLSHVADPGKREPYRRSASFAAGPRTRWHAPNNWIPRSPPPHVCDEFMTIIAIDGFRSRFLQCNESGSERK